MNRPIDRQSAIRLIAEKALAGLTDEALLFIASIGELENFGATLNVFVQNKLNQAIEAPNQED